MISSYEVAIFAFHYLRKNGTIFFMIVTLAFAIVRGMIGRSTTFAVIKNVVIVVIVLSLLFLEVHSVKKITQRTFDPFLFPRKTIKSKRYMFLKKTQKKGYAILKIRYAKKTCALF